MIAINPYYYFNLSLIVLKSHQGCRTTSLFGLPRKCIPFVKFTILTNTTNIRINIDGKPRLQKVMPASFRNNMCQIKKDIWRKAVLHKDNPVISCSIEGIPSNAQLISEGNRFDGVLRCRKSLGK